MKSVAVSVVIPAVRVDEYLDIAVRSVLSGHEDVGLEVVPVLDGCSPADLPAWRDDVRVQVVVLSEHQGTPAALNAGIEASRGELIARLDGDDEAIPGRFRAQQEFLLSSSSVDCVASGVEMIDAGGEKIGVLGVPLESDSISSTLTVRNCIVHSSIMVRREALRAIGGYDVRCARMQDYDLFLRLAINGSLAGMNGQWTRYRVHGLQSSRKTDPWAEYTRVVLRSRNRLARFRGELGVLQFAKNVAWLVVQAGRDARLWRPGYLRRLK